VWEGAWKEREAGGNVAEWVVVVVGVGGGGAEARSGVKGSDPQQTGEAAGVAPGACGSKCQSVVEGVVGSVGGLTAKSDTIAPDGNQQDLCIILDAPAFQCPAWISELACF